MRQSKVALLKIMVKSTLAIDAHCKPATDVAWKPCRSCSGKYRMLSWATCCYLNELLGDTRGEGEIKAKNLRFVRAFTGGVIGGVVSVGDDKVINVFVTKDQVDDILKADPHTDQSEDDTYRDSQSD